MRRAPLLVTAVAGLLLATAGCTPGPAPTPSASVVSLDPGRVSPADLPTPPTVKDPRGAVRDLALGTCETAAGEQSVSGELTSSQAQTADFLVSVSWTTSSGDVLGRGFTVIRDLRPGAARKFTIKARVAPGAVQCVPGVEFGTIKG